MFSSTHIKNQILICFYLLGMLKIHMNSVIHLGEFHDEFPKKTEKKSSCFYHNITTFIILNNSIACIVSQVLNGGDIKIMN